MQKTAQAMERLACMLRAHGVRAAPSQANFLLADFGRDTQRFNEEGIVKAASTLDSMVGCMDERYRDIGWSSARLDDLINFVPARVSGPLLCLAAALTGLDGKNAWRVMRRDHAHHKSMNCAC